MQQVDAALHLLLEGVPAVFWSVDRDLRFTHCSGGGLEALGLRPEDFIGIDLYQFFQTTDPDYEPIAAHRRALGGEAVTYDVEFSGRTFHARVHPVEGTDEGATGVLGIAVDVTERRLAEEALRKSEERYRDLFENALDVLFTTDLTGRITSINRAGERLTGFRRRELLRMNIEDLAAPAHRALVRRVLDLAPRVGDQDFVRTLPSRYELDLLTPQGNTVPVEVVIGLIREGGVPVGVQGTARDISERIQAEAALRESEERYRDVFENARDVIFTLDRAGSFTSVNRAGEAVTGYPREELLGRKFTDLVAPEDAERARAMLTRSDEEERVLDEFEVVTAVDRRIVLEVNSRLVNTEEGPTGFQGIAREITEWKRASEALERSERHFRSLIENALDMIIVVDADLRIRYASPSVRRVLGYGPEDLEGTGVLELVHPDDGDRVVESIDRGLRVPGFTPTVEVRIRHADGSWRVIEGIGENLLNDPAVEGIVVNARDVTDRTRAEQGLHRSLSILRRSDEDRRRLLSQLVNAQEEERARIAADIHDDSLQIMTAVGMRLEMLAGRVQDGPARDELQRLYETVALSVQRLRKLLFDVRPPALDREGISAAIRMSLAQLRADTGIEWDVRSDLPVEPPGPIRTILYRIALEALSNVRKHARADRVTVSLAEDGGGIRMRISDDGVGFDPERVDEERPGHFGLVAMRQRSELTGGSLEVDTAPGRGTTVNVWIPLTPGTTAVAS